RRAKALRCGDAVPLAGAMAQSLLETPVPRALQELIDASDRMRSLADLLTGQLREGRPEQAKGRHFSDFHLCDKRIDKLKGMLRLVVTRTTGDYEAMRLPQVLWPVYYATRPFRLAAQALSALR
ncbi:MAG: hypothetical protein PSV46_01545, partial [Reyranella sp.]|nr:hypothetical protein [Reyranella sp.]